MSVFALHSPAPRALMKRKKNYKPYIFLATMLAMSTAGTVYMVGMKGPGIAGGTKAGEDTAQEFERLAERLRESVVFQCDEVGRRTSRFSAQQRKFDEHMEHVITSSGFKLSVEPYAAGNTRAKNFIGVKQGTEPGVILVGTHYDSYGKSPCANATATGVATLTETLRVLAPEQTKKTVIVAFFGTGERPHRGKDTAGAKIWLDKYLGEGQTLDMALLVGSFGVYIDAPNGQLSSYPWKFLVPDTGDWVGVYGDLAGRATVIEVLEKWGEVSDLPARGFATPTWLPGIPAEDQVPFQEAGLPAVLFSDTGTERSPNLRSRYDNPYELDYVEMARRVDAFTNLVKKYAGAE